MSKTTVLASSTEAPLKPGGCEYQYCLYSLFHSGVQGCRYGWANELSLRGMFVCRHAAADRVELPSLELERGELAVEVGERGVEVRIVRRRAVVDCHEVGEVRP